MGLRDRIAGARFRNKNKTEARRNSEKPYSALNAPNVARAMFEKRVVF